MPLRLEELESYRYTKYEDNRPLTWKVVLGDVEGSEVDKYSAQDEVKVIRTVREEKIVR